MSRMNTTLLTILASTIATTSASLTGPTPPPLARPAVQPSPFNTGHPTRISPARDANKTCVVASSQNNSSTDDDDAPAILGAFRACNHGGTVVLDAEYTVASPLNLTFLDAVDVALTGAVRFTDDIALWTSGAGGGAYGIEYQNSSAFWVVGGTDVNIYGGGVGVLDGRGERWWDASLTNDTLRRPILFVADGLRGATISGLTYLNPPNWFNLIANSTDVVVSGLNLSAVWSTGGETPNTDGWDIYRSDSVVLQDSIVNNGDDCVSFKPNSTNVVVQNLSCNGSHGISVGSLGQYAQEFDVAANLTVFNVSLANAGTGARIKVWPGVESSEGALLDGGGGAGYVRNVTYWVLNNTNNDWAIQIDQCYGQKNTTLCTMYPSKMNISDVWFKDFSGTTSAANEPYVGSLVCSSSLQCWDIYATNINVLPPDGDSPEWICSGFNTSGLEGFDCVTSESEGDSIF